METILNNILDQYYIDMQEDLSHLLTYDTTKDTPKDQAPFGQGIADALKFVLSKAKEWGFISQNLNGYVGLIDFGQGEKQMGVLSHIDTVPVGDGWTVDPFGGQIINNKIYGRGAIDNKGPMIACLYASRAIKESGLPCRHSLRQILGTDEESGFGCMNYFLQNCTPPDFGFTPDAQFPLIYGEKGIVHLELTSDLYPLNGDIVIMNIEGGVGGNVIPDNAQAVLKVSEKGRQILHDFFEQYPQKEDLLLFYEGLTCKIIAKGKTAHGSLPEKGRNAIVLLLDFLYQLPVKSSEDSFITNCYKLLARDLDGTALGAFAQDEYGKTSMAPTLIFTDKLKGSVHIDFRFPIKFKGQYFYDKISEMAAKHDMKISSWKCKEPLYVPPDQPFLQKILSTYREMTGDMSEPMVIGGGTYARVFKNFVGYGPIFPHQEQLSHQANEYISTGDLLFLSKIYSQTIYNLIK
ncbi:MAG: dipeptidase PepV [Bacillota bacterium]|jgi:succinyl-diaminopimelate desuccinylase